MKEEAFNPEDYEVIDLRRKLSSTKFKEGENVVHTDKAGAKLLVNVIGGQTVGWKAVNKEGEEIQSLYVRNPRKGTTTSRAGACYVCAALSGGRYVCWEVSCW